MNALKEWYAYVDRLSRPAEPEAEEIELPVRPPRPGTPEERARAFVAALAEKVGPLEAELPEAAAGAPPAPVFAAPEGSGSLPAFRLPSAPPRVVEPPPQEALPEPEPAPEPPAGIAPAAPVESAPPEEAAPPAPPVEAAPAAPTRAAAPEPEELELRAPEGPPPALAAAPVRGAPPHWELLLRIPENQVTQNSYKSRFKETREELVGRLLDPPLTLEETARLLGVCPATVRRYTNRGQLRHFRTPGNQRRFRLSDVLAFLENGGGAAGPAAEQASPPPAS